MGNPYTAFVSEHRKAGKSLKEIGALWQQSKPAVDPSAAGLPKPRAKRVSKKPVEGVHPEPVSHMDSKPITINAGGPVGAYLPSNAPTQNRNPKLEPEPKLRKPRAKKAAPVEV